MKRTVSSKALADKITAERELRQLGLFEGIDKNLAGRLASIKGPSYIGKDGNGQPFLTRPPEFLKMEVEGLKVRIKYRKEKSGAIDAEFLKGGKNPKKQVEVETDIFSGVRSLKHVRESYEKNFEKLDRVLERIEKVNAELAKEGAAMDGMRIGEIEKLLEAALDEIRRNRAAAKRLGKEKMEEVFGYLEMMKDPMETNRMPMVNAACAKLVAFRNRYDEWRNGQVAKIIAYNKLRECSLRAARDNALVRMCAGWASFVDRYQYAAPKMWKRDRDNSARISRIIAVAGEGNWNAAIAMLADTGSRLDEKGPEGEAKAELRKAYSALVKGRAEAAITCLAAAREILEGSKPWRILPELAKSGDIYLEPTIERISKAVELVMDKNVVKRGAQLFREAAMKLR